MGLQRHLRLTETADFARLRQQGRVYRHRLMLFSVLPNALPHNRYGLVTGKRLGNAVKRNRARRLLREAIRMKDPTLNAGYDVVIVAHPALVGQRLHTVRQALDDLSKQAGLADRPETGQRNESP